MDFWKKNYRCAVSLTFDDGMPSQLQQAIPALNERGLRATFYLNPRREGTLYGESLDWQENLERWLPVHQKGHEIGNHTVSHPCSLNMRADWLDGNNLRDYNLARMESDIKRAQDRIQAVFPDQSSTSFAYPCYESDVGHGLNRVSYVPVIARMFAAGRSRGEYANDPLGCDLHRLSSWPVERQDGAAMIGLVETTLAAQGWGIFTFHGINEGHLPVGLTDFLQLLDHLVRRKPDVWVAPVAEVGDYIAANRT